MSRHHTEYFNYESGLHFCPSCLPKNWQGQQKYNSIVQAAKVGRLCHIVVFNMCAWVWMWMHPLQRSRTSCQSWALAILSSSVITLCFNSLVVSYNYDLPVKYNVDALVALSRACVQVQVFVCVSLCVYMHVHYMCLYVRQGVSVYSTKIYCDCISMCMHILLREQVLVSVCVCVCVCHVPGVPVHGLQKKLLYSSAWIRVSLGKKKSKENMKIATRLCTLRSRQVGTPSSAKRQAFFSNASRWEMTPRLFQRKDTRLKHTPRLHFLSPQPSVSTCMDLGHNNKQISVHSKKAFTTARISWP